MELVIIVTFIAFFTAFLFSSFKVSGNVAQFLFVFGASFFLFVVSYALLAEGIDITFCGNACNTTNYHQSYISLIGIAIALLAVTALMFGVVNAFWTKKTSSRDIETR